MLISTYNEKLLVWIDQFSVKTDCRKTVIKYTFLFEKPEKVVV